jgi:hypothetical protein
MNTESLAWPSLLHPRVRRRIALLAFSLLPLSARAETFPPLFIAKYSVAINGSDAGEMTRTSRRDGNEFLYQSELKATNGLYALLRIGVSESSRWRLQGSQALAEDYQYHQTGIKKRESTVHFDWTRRRVSMLHKKQTSETNATPDMTDRLLYQLLLMRDLREGKQPIRYTVIDGNKVKDYPIEVLGPESLKTPLGNLETVKVRYQKPGSDRSTTLWCAKSLGYLPVKLDHHEDEDDTTSAMIQSVSWTK